MVTPPAPLRIVFFGTPDFAVPSLQALHESPHDVVGVITQPDRARGRGQHSQAGPVKRLAEQLGVPVLQPARLRDEGFLESLRALNAGLGVVAAYGKILTDAVLSIPTQGLINVHASLLPKYRGAAPVHRAVMAGETVTGVTIMRVVKALDAGPMLARAARPIGPDETSEEIEGALAQLGAHLLVDVLDEVGSGRAIETPQDDRLATYAHKLTRQDGLIDWTWPAERLHNLTRGLHPWPLAAAFLDGRRIIVRRTRWSPAPSPLPPGSIVEAAGDRLAIATGEGVLEILELQPEGRRPMTARDFLAGHPLSQGDRFRAP